jgi:hypothetical protein
MSYYTRKQTVKRLAQEEINSSIGITLQAWSTNLDDIRSINTNSNLGRVLVIDPLNAHITTSPLALGTAAYKNIGNSAGNVVIVQPDGKISPSVLPTSASLDGFWKTLTLTTANDGQHFGASNVIPDEAEQQLHLIAGNGIKITGSNEILNKSLQIELIAPNNFASIHTDNMTLSATIPGEQLNISTTGNAIITTIIPDTHTLSINYVATQFTSITSDNGQIIASTSNSNVDVIGGSDISTVNNSEKLQINYTGNQWKTLDYKGYNYNLMGVGTHTAQSSIDSLEITAGYGLAIESNAITKKLTIRSQYLERATAIEGMNGDVIDGGEYGELYNGYTYDGGTYYSYDGGTY